jgi:hypothetical protein
VATDATWLEDYYDEYGQRLLKGAWSTKRIMAATGLDEKRARAFNTYCRQKRSHRAWGTPVPDYPPPDGWSPGVFPPIGLAAAREMEEPEEQGEAFRATAVVHDEKQAISLQRTKDELSKVKRLLREQRREDSLAAEIRETAFGLAQAHLQSPTWASSPTGVHGSAGVPTLLLSDFHWGEVVLAEEVWGTNEYDLETAARRLRRVIDTACYLLDEVVVSPEGYPGIVLALAGDMVSGGIHEELLATDAKPPAACVVDLAEQLAAAIDRLADTFGRVFIPCVTGNHGRTTRRTWKKKRVETSWDWMLYLMLEQRFAGDDRVKFAVSQDTDVLYSVAGKSYLLTHGDELGVRGGNGIIGALGPIMRGRHKIASANADLGREHDVLVMGHWHQYINLRHVIVNGSLKGYDEYARASRFSYEPPTQALWITHPEHGVTISMPVFADDEERPVEQAWEFLT